MPTVYEQIWSRLESGKGEIQFRFLISDDYDALFSGEDYDARISIDFIRIGTLKSDLDTAEGMQGVDELQVSIDRTACKTTVDVTAFSFVLECLDDEVNRYCLLYADGGLAFRGILNSKADGEDIVWFGNEYDTDPAPFREWKLTAKNYAIVKLDRKIQEIMDFWKSSTEDVNLYDQWTDDWIDENVRNRNAYQPWANGDIDTWETYVKFGSLVNLNKLLRKLLDLIEEIDSTCVCVLEEVELPYIFFTPEIIPYISGWDKGRYAHIDKIQARLTQSKVASIGEDVSDDNSPFVSFKLVDPDEKEKNDSFYITDKFINLLFQIARSFGMYADLKVDAEGVTHITFLSRERITKNEDGSIKQLYIKSPESASITTEPIMFDVEKGSYVGVANQYALDADPGYVLTGSTDVTDYIRVPLGVDEYGYDTSNEKPSYKESRLRGKVGNLTPTLLSSGVTIANITPDILGAQVGVGNAFFPSKTLRYYYVIMNDALTVRSTRDVTWQGGNMLHNTFVRFSDDDYQGRFGSIHRLIYFKTVERHYRRVDDNYIRSTDSDDEFTSFRPSWFLSAKVDDETKYYSTLSKFVNEVAQRDGKYFQTEYSLTIPYLSGFRSEVGGDDSYHNLTLGSVTVIDDLDYVVVGIERDFDKIETKLRLHNLERFAFTSPDSPSGEAAGEVPFITAPPSIATPTSPVKRFIASGDILAGNAVAETDTGVVEFAIPTENHYRRVIGIALNNALDGEYIDVCQGGECSMPVDTMGFLFIPGRPIYLVKRDDDDNNVSLSPISPSNDEYVIQRLGHSVTPDRIFVNIEEPRWWWGWPT